MGRDFRFRVYGSYKQAVDDLDGPLGDFEVWSDVGRHNNHMLFGIYNREQLREAIQELAEKITDDDYSDDIDDLAEAISVAAKLLRHVYGNDAVRIIYE